MLRVLVLGAAAGGGLPQWNCGCINCEAARKPGSGVQPQTQSSLAVSADGSDWVLLNASPDIREQLARDRRFRPKTLRGSPVQSVVLTNGDLDHIAGLLVLREKQAFTVHATEAVLSVLAANPIFRALDPDLVEMRTAELDQAFEPLPGIEATLFTVPGKVPLFLEEGEPETDLEGEQTVGIELRSGSKRVCYIPGCARVTASLAARLDGADVVFFDGTVYSDDEMLKAGVGAKSGRRMGHIPIGGAGGSLEAFSATRLGRKIYVHINNTNPMWRPGPERQAVEASGWEIAQDGMEIVL